MQNLRKLGSCLRSTSVATLIAVSVAVSGGCGRSESSESSAPSLVVDRAPAGVRKMDIEFDGKIQLAGYKISRRPLKAGQPVTVSMYWKVLAKVEPGYRLTSKLLDDAGERLVDLDTASVLREQKDGKPTMAPDTWQVGKIYVDEVKFVVPRNVKTARVQFVSGFVKGDEKLKVTVGGTVDGLAVVLTSATDVKAARKGKAPSVPSMRIDQLDAKTKIKLDGKLDEEAWTSAPVFNLKDTITGAAPKKSTVNGNVRLAWSKEGLYVAMEVLDSDIIGGFEKGAKDAHLWTKDAIEILIDADGDNKDYYEVQISPQNLVFDSQYDDYNTPVKEPDGPFGHEEWTANLKSAVTIQGTLDKSDDEDQGYVIEALLPWKSFAKFKGTAPAVGDTWRMNFFALNAGKAVSWSPMLKNDSFHKASRFGRVLFATKDWVEPAAAPEGGEVAKAPAPADSAATEVAAKPLPSGIAERVQAAKPAPAAPAPAAPAPAPAAAPAPSAK